MGKCLRCLTRDATVMALAMDTTDIVGEAERIHGTSAVVTAALGRLLTAASMMGILLKGQEDTVTLKIDGGGPAGSVMAVSDSRGDVRGYAAHPVVEIPLKPNGKLDVGTAVGRDGMLHVLRDTGAPQPYIGSVPLVSGEIAEDITSYYAISEQVPTVCALGVLVNPDLSVKCAGGFLVQLLPFCPEGVIDQVEETVAALPSVTAMLESGMTPRIMMDKLLAGFAYDILDEYEPVYRCNCSRERVERAFSAMRPEELLSLPDENGRVEATCSFCDKTYHFTIADLEKMVASREEAE